MKRPITSRVPPVTAILVRIAIIPMMALPACSALAGPTVAPERATPAPATQATTFSVSGTQSPAAAGSPSPVGTNAPSATPNEHETLKAIYNSHATTVAAAGDRTLVPYETSAAQGTRFAAEQTQYVENQNTPTPFGPLPFPGTRLTDAELAQRGWPRMKEDGQRNNDYRTSAIWLDKAYVDAEIFSKYQALFDLLAFRDGPPGDDFEARLRELMLPSEPAGSELDEAVINSGRDRNLASCTFGAIKVNVAELARGGAYIRVLEDSLGFNIVWQYIEDQPAPIGAYLDKAIAFQLGDYYVVLLRIALQDPARSESLGGLYVRFQRIAMQTGRVMQEWNAPYEVADTNEAFVAVWLPELKDWRILKYESPYCEDYFPNSLRP